MGQLELIMKIGILIILFVLLFGCAEKRLDIQEVKVPILYCPKPSVIERPSLSIVTITEDDTAGEVAKKYKATIKVLQDYSIRLEEVVKSYNDVNMSYEELRNKLETNK